MGFYSECHYSLDDHHDVCLLQETKMWSDETKELFRDFEMYTNSAIDAQMPFRLCGTEGDDFGLAILVRKSIKSTFRSSSSNCLAIDLHLGGKRVIIAIIYAPCEFAHSTRSDLEKFDRVVQPEDWSPDEFDEKLRKIQKKKRHGENVKHSGAYVRMPPTSKEVLC